MARELIDRPDGLHATFHLTGRRKDAALTVSMIKSGHLSAASVEFFPLEHRTEAGVVRRVRAELTGVALCRQGVYAEAKVLAARCVPGWKSVGFGGPSRSALGLRSLRSREPPGEGDANRKGGSHDER